MISFKFDRRYYSGQEKRSLPHGYGVYQSPFDDFRYEGKWNGVEMQDVEGKLFWKNGSLYQGSFKHGQISGEGFKKCVETRTEYRGGFELGLKHGEGLVLYSDGSWYDGPWQNDKREGIGMWTSLDENEEYHGHFLNDYRDGEGSCRYSNGDKYEGQWTRGLRDGKGTMWHTSGIVYKGLWTNDKPSDRPLAIKIKTESHIEVSSNEHEITLIVDCVRKDGGVSYSGDCVLMVCDITEPNFFGPPLDPDYIPLKLLFPKKSKGNRFKPQKTRSVTHGKHTSPNA